MLSVFCCFASARDPAARVPVLVYHRFGLTAADSMTVSTQTFDSQLSTIQKLGYHVIPLRQLTDFLLSDGAPALPVHALVITADDGHESIYTEMMPRMKRYGYPATLFIYPSAISNAKWAMTWAQLTELEKAGLCDIQSHTYWHPNFKIEKRRLAPAEYEKFVQWQMVRAKATLESKLGKHIDLLAWPFGIYDDWLLQAAKLAGYRAGFTLDARPATDSDKPLALPRYLMTDTMRGVRFERLLADASAVLRH